MRIAVTSDLHLPKTPAEIIEGVAAEIANKLQPFTARSSP